MSKGKRDCSKGKALFHLEFRQKNSTTVLHAEIYHTEIITFWEDAV